MLDLLTTGGFGVITGFIGSIVTGITNYKMLKEKNKHEIDLIAANAEAVKIEAEANIKITNAKTEGEIAVAEMAALKTSYETANIPIFDKSYMKMLMDSKWTAWIGAIIAFFFGVAETLSKLARPVLTYYLMGASTWVTVLAYELLKKVNGEVLSAADALDLFRLTTVTILYLTVTCVSWHFCDRQVSKFMAGQLQNKFNSQ
jgi:hypothetical protein